jgi:F-type H+-transporting ATPase subunit gamma
MAAKLRLYKEKLEGYKKFYQIVKTIKMVNLAKFRQTVERVKTRDSSVRYVGKCFDTKVEQLAAMEAAKETMLYIPITTNRGSCGALNSQVFNYIESVIAPKVKVLGVGKKANDTCPKRFGNEYMYNIANDFKGPLNFNYASFIVEHAQEVKNVERTQYVFNRFVSAGAQRMACYNIPAYDKWIEKLNDSASTENDKDNYNFANALLNNDDQVVRDYFEFQTTMAVLNAVSENELSEYAARMMAVEGQLTNIMQLQHHTNYLYNKTRQGSITAALIEILSAISAMEGNASKGVKKDAFWMTK